MSDRNRCAVSEDHSDEPKQSLRHGLGYGLLGLPLAFMALPLYVHLPHVYASRYGMSLTTLGTVLLLARLFDALTDPWLGHWGDRLSARSPRRVLIAGNVAALVLVLGMSMLFFPPWSRANNPIALFAMLILTYLAYSLLTICHQSWGARLGGGEAQRARIVAWREGSGLLGVVLASVLPGWLSWEEWLTVFALALAVGCWAWNFSVVPPHSICAEKRSWLDDMRHPWRQAPFRRLMAVYILSGMASAIPATLVLFFIRDQLNAASLEPLFLATYFVAAAASLPLWMHGVARWGLSRCWLTGMLLSVTVFMWAASLGTSDVVGFWWVCVLSGLALGADLALPGAMLAGIIAERGDRGSREGTYFGWWNLAGKLNLALAAGLALPLLELLGYQPGTTSIDGLHALTIAYSVLPCTLKLLAAALLYLTLIRHAPLTPSTFMESP